MSAPILSDAEFLRVLARKLAKYEVSFLGREESRRLSRIADDLDALGRELNKTNTDASAPQSTEER